MSEEQKTDPNKTNTPVTRTRYRVLFEKRGVLRYTSHLDLARIWERVLRRANVDLVYSQGFNPRPKIQLAAALPLGLEGAGEIMDMWVKTSYGDLGEAAATIQHVSPEGLIVKEIYEIDLKEPSLQASTTSATYQVVLDDSVDTVNLRERIDDLLEAEEIARERRGKQYNLRPLIIELALNITEHEATLEMELALSAQNGTGRADEVLGALGIDATASNVVRTGINL